LPGNNRGLRLTPLPQLYVNPISGGVFVGLGSDIVRGERDGAFTRFTRFVDTTPVTPGSVQRSSLLSAMTVLQSAQELQTDTDLAVGITSPALVLVDGNTGRYDITLRNDAALAADATVVTLALPDGASYAGSSVACADGGATVACDFGRMAPLTQQSLTISFTIATATVRDLTATVSATSATAERNPTNNSASHTTITAAPTLAALPGIPYIYYGDTERLTRVGLFDSYGVEPLFMDANLSGSTLAADLVRNRVYIVTAAGKLVAVDPDGGNRVEIADTNPNTIDAQGRNRVAVDESTGRVYWSEINTIALTTIKSANPDGSDLQTIIGDIRDQRGLVVDPVRGKLLWVGTDLARRQELIFAANLDGSELALLYTAPEGAQIRYLALDPYAQKLYWIDPAAEDGGTLFWADADGGRLAVLNPYLNRNAAGLVVRPQENALYYVTGAELYRAELNGANETFLAALYPEPYTGLALPANPTAFQQTFIQPPTGNLAFVIGTPFAAPPCVVNDTHEPNNGASTATAIAVGTTTGALCTTDSTLPQDIDFYQISVPNNQQLNITLRNLPADYNLYVQRLGQTLATGLNSGLADESVALPNYQGTGDYLIVVFSSSPVN
ncbi:MAG: hypothetical protein KDE53_28000, partial [Caldilineaceae bacterium]|nr:hypothetical protein [Caldilineaceae bacterium]